MNAPYTINTNGRRQCRNWLERNNPLRGLTPRLAGTLLEAYPRGDMTQLQWAYASIEQSDPDLFALVERRASAVVELDWDIHLAEEQAEASDDSRGRSSAGGSLAREQAACLREAYDRIENLCDAIEHLAMASFRGYAHLEKHHDSAGRVSRFEICDQWNLVRDGLRGRWKYNPEARPAPFRCLPDTMLIEPEGWIIRETKRHIDHLGLVKYVRQNLSLKDWDSYVETFGLPGAVVIGPPQASAGSESSYETAAARIAQGGSGYLPHGSSVQFSETRSGTPPFADHLRHLTEQLVLAGTGGLLTMLTASGSGTLAGHAHQDAFNRIARMEARQIEAVLHKQFEAQILNRHFPEMSHQAWFGFSLSDAESVGAVVDHAAKLRQAGYAMDAAQIAEKTGYRIESASGRIL